MRGTMTECFETYAYQSPISISLFEAVFSLTPAVTSLGTLTIPAAIESGTRYCFVVPPGSSGVVVVKKIINSLDPFSYAKCTGGNCTPFQATPFTSLQGDSVQL